MGGADDERDMSMLQRHVAAVQPPPYPPGTGGSLQSARAGVIGELAGGHRRRDGIDARSAAERTGVSVLLPDFDQAGALAGIAGSAEDITAAAIAVHATVLVVGREAAVIDPAAALTFGTGLGLIGRRDFASFFSFRGRHDAPL